MLTIITISDPSFNYLVSITVDMLFYFESLENIPNLLCLRHCRDITEKTTTS